MTIAIARQAARGLFKEAAPSLPVDLDELLKWRGLSLIRASDWPEHLCARYYPVEKTIVVNGNQAHVRQRFSIAHEFGHFVLGHDQADIDHTITTIFGDEDESYLVEGDIEQEANAFAAELLMPRDWVRQQAVGRSATELAEVIKAGCTVSGPAAWYRMMELRVAEFARPPHRRR